MGVNDALMCGGVRHFFLFDDMARFVDGIWVIMDTRDWVMSASIGSGSVGVVDGLACGVGG
jgi:hypothetical protein